VSGLPEFRHRNLLAGSSTISADTLLAAAQLTS
jgi:hypothetical protein